MSRALARLLPIVEDRYPRPLYDAILRFVVEKGDLSPEERRPLESLLSPPNG